MPPAKGQKTTIPALRRQYKHIPLTRQGKIVSVSEPFTLILPFI
jgi:hypothetical protein